jgi:hypothetical protein
MLCPRPAPTERPQVVPLDSLLDVLARAPAPADDGLAARVHHLLVPSYLPNAQEGAVRAVRRAP